MNLERARHNMVEQQIRTWEVLDQTVLDLLYTVRREEFVPQAYRSLAFADLEIPLSPGGAARGENMLAPKLEARILQEVAPQPTDTVLEVGTGSGYMAALLGARAKGVITIEINPALAAVAEANLTRSGCANVTVERGDGAHGLPRRAPFDVIVMSGSLAVLADSLVEQLAPGGRLFAVVGAPPIQSARLVTRADDGHAERPSYRAIDLFETRVAPLSGGPQPSRFNF